LPAPDLVKIDVEGMELAVLQGMRATVAARRPRVYIEMHGATQDAKEANARAVVAELWSQGYRILTHVESGAAIAPENATRAATGHLSVS
ncbi:MAG: FkbM family methyltransferase, partial [Gemmatimonadaceae bacterium]